MAAATLERETIWNVNKANLHLAQQRPKLVNLAIEKAVLTGIREVTLNFRRAQDAEEMRDYINSNSRYEACVFETLLAQPNVETKSYQIRFVLPDVPEEKLIIFQELVKQHKKAQEELNKGRYFGGGGAGIYPCSIVDKPQDVGPDPENTPDLPKEEELEDDEKVVRSST